jgi:DNA-binding transcriptional LysR family regulator
MPRYAFGKNAVAPEVLAEHQWVYRSFPVPEANYFAPPDGAFSGSIADNMEAAAILIMSGQYIGYLPREFAAAYVKQGLLSAPNQKRCKYEITFHMVTRKRPFRNEVVRAFVEDLSALYLGTP